MHMKKKIYISIIAGLSSTLVASESPALPTDLLPELRHHFHADPSVQKTLGSEAQAIKERPSQSTAPEETEPVILNMNLNRTKTDERKTSKYYVERAQHSAAQHTPQSIQPNLEQPRDRSMLSWVLQHKMRATLLCIGSLYTITQGYIWYLSHMLKKQSILRQQAMIHYRSHSLNTEPKHEQLETELPPELLHATYNEKYYLKKYQALISFLESTYLSKLFFYEKLPQKS